MADEHSLGPLGPNVISIESISGTAYSVQGSNFASGFHAEVRDGVGQIIERTTVADRSGTAFTLTLPYMTPGPCTLTVINPDGRSSVQRFATPGTSSSNESLRAR